MRVIEEKHIHEKEALCTHCGSTLGYYPEDIIIDPTHYVTIYIKCPVCGKRIILHTFNISEYWEWEKDFKKWKDGV